MHWESPADDNLSKPALEKNGEEITCFTLTTFQNTTVINNDTCIYVYVL